MNLTVKESMKRVFISIGTRSVPQTHISMLKNRILPCSATLLLCGLSSMAEPNGTPENPAPPTSDPFRDAVAVWHMNGLKDTAGKNELKVVGAVTTGVKLEGKELEESLASGNDGLVARLEGGYLDAGQGTDGMLNVKGSALTVSVRLRNPSGVWNKPLFSKHGGYGRLVYNLFSFDWAIGFELGTRDIPGMTQVTAPLEKIGPRDWHTVICRYDGTKLQMFVDGVLMSQANPEGPLREGNTEPCLIGAESNDGRINSGWQGLIDHAAIWNRALSDAEIELLSGGAARVAALKLVYPKAPPPPTANIRSFLADKRYLVFPSTRGRTGRDKVTIDVDGKPYLWVADALIDASPEPDHWRFIDLKLMQGKTVSVKIQGPDVAALDMVKLSDDIPGKYPVYQEPGRPQVHFSPLRGSLNDPAGMFYYQGTWHLYYANKRFYNDWGNLNSTWGHATSTDLVHWEEQPLFLAAVDGKYSFWTGGAAVDVENATGLGKPGKPVIVYSANNGAWGPNPFTQCVFVSTDDGMTAQWNPEMMYKPLPKEDSRRGGGTRDPMILWYAPEKKWVMVVYNQAAGRNGFYFFESKDLKNWTETSVLDDMFECPNLFQLPVDGKKDDMRWVTWGSPNEYLIGKFNGKAFLPDDNRRQRVNLGQFSASQVFSNAPEGRIVQIGFAHCCDYDGEFSNMAAFPLDLTLRTTPEGLRLHADFVPELAKLRKIGSQQQDLVVKNSVPLVVGDLSQPAEIIAEFDPGKATRVSFTGAELNITWNAQIQELEVNGEKTKLSLQNGRAALHILLDIPSVEVVTSRGDYLIKSRDYRKLGEKSPLEIRTEGGDVKFNRLEVYPLKSIHTDKS